MDNNNLANSNALAPTAAAPETQTPAQPTAPKNKSKYTKIILICTIAAICLTIGILVVLANVKITKPTTPEADTPTNATIPSIPTEPEDPTEPEEPEPIITQSGNTDYATLEKTIIPARDDNGRIADHVRGKTDSKVIVIEYADMQCPGCGAMMSRMSTVYQEYKDRVAFVFRHYPISGHPKAMPAAIATEAAGRQGYFWEMTEALYVGQNSWVSLSDSSLNSYFLSVFKQVAPSGNPEKFSKDLSNASIKTKIQFDAMLGRDYAKIPGTPSIFVNGVLIDDFTTYESFINTLKAKINAELKK